MRQEQWGNARLVQTLQKGGLVPLDQLLSSAVS